MRSLFFILLFVSIPFLLMSSETIDGVMGLKFGSTREQVKQFMSKKSDTKLDVGNCDIDKLTYLDGTFAGKKTEFMEFKFVNDKFYSFTTCFPVELKSQVIDTYKEIREDLNQKYYITDKIIETYEYPFEAEDGQTEAAIQLGKAKFTSVWVFNGLLNSDFNNLIVLVIADNFRVFLNYNECSLSHIADEKEKEKTMTDY